MKLIKNLLPLLLGSVLSAYASDNEDPATIHLGKRSLLPEIELPPLKRQVFARATYDTTSKHILTDDEIRLDFIRTFSGLTNITSTQKLDEALQPLKKLSNFREILNSQQTEIFLKRLQETDANVQVTRPKGKKSKKIVNDPAGLTLLQELSKNYDEIRTTLAPERNSQLDVLCRLSDGSYAMVEIQVAKQDYWDKRALAYLGSVYGRQLSMGGKWENLKGVIGINILGGGPKDIPLWAKAKAAGTVPPVRHYQFQDKYEPYNIIPEMQLIQYSLGDADLEAEPIRSNKNLHDWLDYFKNAHQKGDMPADISDPLKKAYELIKFEHMSEEMKKGYNVEDTYFNNYNEHIKKEKEESKAEGLAEGIRQTALGLLVENIPLETIIKVTKLSHEELEALKGTLEADEPSAVNP